MTRLLIKFIYFNVYIKLLNYKTNRFLLRILQGCLLAGCVYKLPHAIDMKSKCTVKSYQLQGQTWNLHQKKGYKNNLSFSNPTGHLANILPTHSP